MKLGLPHPVYISDKVLLLHTYLFISNLSSLKGWNVPAHVDIKNFDTTRQVHNKVIVLK